MSYNAILRMLVLAFAACGFLAFWLPRPGIIGMVLCVVAAVAVLVLRRMDRGNDAQRWIAGGGHPLILTLPFEGEWEVITANEHGVDFVRLDSSSWQSTVFAPCDGLVAHVEDGHEDGAPPATPHRDRRAPLGNYISIETPRGYVVLGHLEAKSFEVRAGASVRAGAPIARCGNSGVTRCAQVHLHAQNRALFDPDLAQMIPVALVATPGAEPMLYEEGDRVTGVPR